MPTTLQEMSEEQLRRFEEKMTKMLEIESNTVMSKKQSITNKFIKGLTENESEIFNQLHTSNFNNRDSIPLRNLKHIAKILYTSSVNGVIIGDRFNQLEADSLSGKIDNLFLKAYMIVHQHNIDKSDNSKFALMLEIQENGNNLERGQLLNWLKNDFRKDARIGLKEYKEDLYKFFKALAKLEVGSTIEFDAKKVLNEMNDTEKTKKFTNLIDHRFLNDPASSQFKKIVESFIEKGPKDAMKDLENLINNRKLGVNPSRR